MMKPKRKYFFILAIFFFIVGCSSKNDSFKPDLSTPESAARTIKYAAANNLGDVFLDSIAKEMKERYYGATHEQQLKTFNESAKKKKKGGPFSGSTLRIDKVEPVGSDAETVDVFSTQIAKDGKTLSGVARFVKEEGLWKLTERTRTARTPEELAELEKSKEVLRSEFVLDKEKNAWVKVEKKQSESR